MPERIVALSQQVSAVATSKIEEIRRVTQGTKILAVNAAIEASRAGAAGAGFSIVADEVKAISVTIDSLAEQLHDQVHDKAKELNVLGQKLIASIRGSRLADLALNVIDIIDRNLYERSCDVRWWATDSAVVDCVTTPELNTSQYASKRLGVILDSYTVYLDLWIADLNGRVLANGRPRLYPTVKGLNVSSEDWFRRAKATRDGTEFIACDIAVNQALGSSKVATYATAIRANGATDGKVLGVLGIFFDWEKQSQAVVKGIRLSEEERSNTRCLILNAQHQIIAASDKSGIFERYPIEAKGQRMGTYVDSLGALVGFALTPGYETYQGLGWYGVLVQNRRDHASTSAKPH
jgi:hypothetical protein